MKSTLLFVILACSSVLLHAQKPGAYKCLDLDGSNDYVALKDHNSLNPSKAITVEAWIKPDNFGTNVWSNSIFCKHGWASGNAGYVLRCGDGGKLSFNLSDDNGTWREVNSSAVMNTGQWYHVAGTFDGDTIAVYINGKQMATTLYSGGIRTSTGLAAKIGDLANGSGGRRFDGMIDEVRVWSSAVSEATLRDWMCRKVSSAHPDYSNLEGYWKLDEDSGTSTKDHSTNSNTGTYTNSPSITISGAAIGDTSAHTYGGAKVQLNVANSYNLITRNIAGRPDMVHVYAVKGKTGQSVASGSDGTVDTTLYFGVFHPASSSVTYDAVLDYTNAKHLSGTNKCGIALFRKTPGYRGSWTSTNAQFTGGGDSLLAKGEKLSEYIAGFVASDSNKVISTHTGKRYLCGRDSLVLTATGNDSFSYVWYLNGNVISGANKRSYAADSAGTYRVKVSRASANCSYESSNVELKRHHPGAVTFAALTDLCEEEDSIKLGGVSPIGGIFSGSGLDGDYFRPAVVGDGSYDITYTFTDTFACSVSKVQIQVVHPTPELTRPSNLEYCSNLDSLKMDMVKPVGGTYSGAYYYNNYLRLDSAGNREGYYPFVYTFTSTKGCVNALTDSVKIKWATPVRIQVKDTACLQDDSVDLSGIPATGTFSGTGVVNSAFFPRRAGKGRHTVSYSFTNALNCTSTASKLITVIPNIDVTWTDSINLCLNAKRINVYPGTPSGGKVSGNGVLGWYFFPRRAGAGQHELKYTVKDTNGCNSSATVTAIVRDTATVSYSAALTHCLQIDPIPLNAGQPVGGTYALNGQPSDSIFPSKLGHGTHSLTYDITGNNGCKSQGAFDLIVLKPDSTHVLADNIHCLEDDAVVINTYPAGGELKGKGLIRNIFTPRFAGEGAHHIVYTITDSKACVVRDTLTMFVYDAPTIDLTPIPNLCVNGQAIFLNQYGSSSDSSWFLVNGVRADVIRPNVLGVGQHSLAFKSTNNAGCRDSVEQMFEVLRIPPKPTIRLQKNTLVATASRNYQWYNAAGKMTDSTNREMSPSTNGSYLVKVSSDSGCVVSSDSFAFTYVGISNVLPNNIKVYPNPAEGWVYVTGKPGLQLTLYDQVGREVDVPIEHTRLNLSNLPAAMYRLVILDGTKVYTVLLIKH